MIRFKIALDNWLSKKILINSVKTAIIFGIILAFINYGDLIIIEALTTQCMMRRGQICFVPYSVGSWTATKAEMALDICSALIWHAHPPKNNAREKDNNLVGRRLRVGTNTPSCDQNFLIAGMLRSHKTMDQGSFKR